MTSRGLSKASAGGRAKLAERPNSAGKRGRPSKASVAEDKQEEPAVVRKRGRPSKASGAEDKEQEAEQPVRKRGRPSKASFAATENVNEEATTTE
ncbi:hypothetical protein R3P38DRAFT_3268096 [Favolaschia claudopus]|uniref:Uncharacterized protein n=1 Tax=Favolaschia claudopus TaxID=2862362 RepID=A0AAW0BLI1_9AGAR